MQQRIMAGLLGAVALVLWLALVAPASAQTPVFPTQSELPTRRTFAIVFDDLHIGDINIAQAKKAVEAFVAKQILPGDRLVLFTTSRDEASGRTFEAREPFRVEPPAAVQAKPPSS